MSADGKRSRWAANPQPAVTSSSNSNTISDSDAIQALLSSAQKHEDQRPQKHRRFHDRPRDGPRRDEPRNLERNDETRRSYGDYDSTDFRDHDKGRSKFAGAQEETTSELVEKEKPNFGLSGALAKDEDKGNVFKGVALKFSEPPEARAPNTQWRLYVFKGEENLETLHISRQSAFLLGRNEDIADIPLRHGSCSSQHAVIQYRALPNPETGKLQCSPYLMDLESTNGSFINGVQIEPARYYQLKKGDVLKFGASTREYVLLTANTTSIES
jgi:smad nuclear-interacting protein 1